MFNYATHYTESMLKLTETDNRVIEGPITLVQEALKGPVNGRKSLL